MNDYLRTVKLFYFLLKKSLTYSSYSGIFELFKNSTRIKNKPSWLDEHIYLDVMYQNRSRDKIMTEYFGDLCFTYDFSKNKEVLNEENIFDMIDSIWYKFIPKWSKLWDAINENYNPLENENYKIIRDELITDKKNKKTEHENIIDIKIKQNESDTENVDNNSSSVSTEKERAHNDDYFYGFNSENGVGTSGTENNNITDNDSNTRTKQDRQYVSKSDRDTLTNDNLNKSEDENNQRNVESMDTHSGNNGKNTFQDLLNQELEVRKNLFYEIVFTDIDSVLTIPVY